MIYIISEKSDLTTDLVIEWIINFKKKVIRFNQDVLISCKTNLGDSKEQDLELSDAKKIWHRRGLLNTLPLQLFGDYSGNSELVRYLSRENQVYTAYLENKLKRKLKQNYIGSIQRELNNNKLINLEIAKQIGLNIPATQITTNKKDLLAFYREHEKIITKDLRAPVKVSIKNEVLVSTGVELVSKKKINTLGENFAAIFCQEYIEKQYEIRVFAFQGTLFPMAIFSQNNLDTKIDYRNYSQSKPNRNVPVKIPKDIEDMILEFMNQLDLRTGSMDLIVTPSDEYYFLEINPMGQFHWLSQNCNYQIEREIAKVLTDEE